MTKRGRPRKERYARLMGGLWRNPKVRRLSNEALGVLTRAWSYAADEMTDGRVPVDMLEMWARPKRWPAVRSELTAALAGNPLLVIEDGAIDAVCHGWTDINITAEAWEKKLESDRNRKHFPTGNPTGNAPDIPTGNASIFQDHALDEDEDEENSSLRSESARVATRSADDGPTPTSIVEAALVTALGRAGAKLVLRSGDVRHLRDAAASMKAGDSRPLRDVAAEWCADFVAEFRSRTPKNLALYAQSRTANGGAKVATATSRARPSGWQAPADASAFTQTEITPDLFRKESLDG